MDMQMRKKICLSAIGIYGIIFFTILGLYFVFLAYSQKTKTFTTKAALRNATTPTPIPKKILILGDSFIRYGTYPDYYDLLDAGVGSSYKLLFPPEDHIGYSANVFAEDLKKGKWRDGKGFIRRKNNPEVTPDILLTRVGTNDVLFSYKSMDESAKSFQSIIDYYKEINPNLVIILDFVPSIYGTPPPTKKTQKRIEEERVLLNNKLEALTQTKNIYRAAIVPLLLTDVESDGVHPNKSGNTKLTQNVLKTIQSIK